MKDVKKSYREQFSHLKNLKSEFKDAQDQIDMVKEQLIASFEQWYGEEFE